MAKTWDVEVEDNSAAFHATVRVTADSATEAIWRAEKEALRNNDLPWEAYSFELDTTRVKAAAWAEVTDAAEKTT